MNFWVRPTRGMSPATILSATSASSASSPALLIKLTNGKLTCSFNGSEISGEVIAQKEWTKIRFERITNNFGSLIKLYINDRSSINYVNQIFDNGRNLNIKFGSFWLGQNSFNVNNNQDPNQFIGEIDDLVISTDIYP